MKRHTCLRSHLALHTDVFEEPAEGGHPLCCSTVTKHEQSTLPSKKHDSAELWLETIQEGNIHHSAHMHLKSQCLEFSWHNSTHQSERAAVAFESQTEFVCLSTDSEICQSVWWSLTFVPRH